MMVFLKVEQVESDFHLTKLRQHDHVQASTALRRQERQAVHDVETRGKAELAAEAGTHDGQDTIAQLFITFSK